MEGVISQAKAGRNEDTGAAYVGLHGDSEGPWECEDLNASAGS